jgi:tyrosyl-tRNA synthetase
VMEMYYTLATDEAPETFRPLIQNDPRNAKVGLAKHVIARFHSRDDAAAAEAEFNKVFKEKGVPDEMPEFTVGPGPHKIAPLLVAAKLANSNGEGNRKVGEGAVSIDGEKVTDFKKEITLQKPIVIKLGRKFARVKP